MTENTNFKISNLLTNNWVVTLSATLFGVLMALYLNQWMASRNLENQKAIATKNILLETSSNHEQLNKSIVKQKKMLVAMEFLGEYMNEEEDLITSPDRMNAFRTENPGLITIKDSTLLDNGNYNYDGELNLDLGILHLDLSNIVWQTLKSSGISSAYDFECLMYLEMVDKIIRDIMTRNEELLAFFMGAKDSGTKNEHLIKHLKLLLNFEESLSGIYDSSEERLKACE